MAPDEIVVVDDGSTDDTFGHLQAYEPRITVIRQRNGGVANARNVLCDRAESEIVAFLDADDIWHPRYLEMQRRLIESCPEAVAYFTGHENLFGCGCYDWKNGAAELPLNPFIIRPKEFIKLCNARPLDFQLSCSCIRKRVLQEIGHEPFRVSGVEDTYFHMLLPFRGLIVHAPLRLVAYRITRSSLSADRLRNSLLVLDAFKALEEQYESIKNPSLYKEFTVAYASRRRNCGKFLMGSGRLREARRVLRESIPTSANLASMAKSLALLVSTFMPRFVQPVWPSSSR